MRFALAGGGTGGHAYPAIAVAERLREDHHADLVYYGTPHGPERAAAEQAGIPFRAVPARQIRGRSPWRLATGLASLWRGTETAARWLAEDRPQAVFATGGYAAAPVGRAARRLGVPLIVFLPDVHPGWAVRFLARYASTVACSVDASLAALPAGRGVVTGYPVRRQFLEATREEGVARFGLDPALRTVLVAGGSLGAQQINRAVAAGLPGLLERAQLVHISGAEDEAWLQGERARLPAALRARYHLHAYTQEMAYAMRAADLAVTRAGASTLGELPVTGLPAILVPGGFSDQHRNAAHLADQGAALVLPSTRLEELHGLIVALIDDDQRRTGMAEAMRRHARPDAAGRLAALMMEAAA
ncbi:MAG: UDP-N-acetylglucosamine--N-acetylmuramyl-(pentapeptide) pyrophosphoryl-undecaprenol N-acetylglucosamine transferase [Dehalococcoidia bacterium]